MHNSTKVKIQKKVLISKEFGAQKVRQQRLQYKISRQRQVKITGKKQSRNTEDQAQKQSLDAGARTRWTRNNNDWGVNPRRSGDNETQVQTTRAVETNHKGRNPGQEVTGRTKGQQNMETILHGKTFLSIFLMKLLDRVRVYSVILLC